MTLRRWTGLAPARRRGFTVFELAVAVFLMLIAMSLTTQLLSAIARERSAAVRRELATREVANLMEHVAARSWDRLTTEGVKEVKLSDQADRALPGAELSIAVEESSRPGIGPAKRVAVRLRWRNRAGGLDAPVRLTAWVHREVAR